MGGRRGGGEICVVAEADENHESIFFFILSHI